ncbi:uncharacterized protein LOC121732394 [Aricia agestis]|uniref:uncharacterized protein LOC121732394 n=1 Tax=Aricia agestis TaxID=91739 RepID=UPI001C207B12|nr:uncharacterized protein LOC121732394 [Aricia agestis]
MNFIIILIFIQCTENVICFYLNSSLNGSLGCTSSSQNRHKRAPSEYTRWRADFEPTEEFIVKVFEEDSPARNSQVAPVDIGNDRPVNNVKRPFRGGGGPDDAESAEIGIDPNTDLIINPFSKSKLDDSDNALVPVYSNNKIISQKTFKGKDTKYPKVKYMSVQNENQDALLGSGFLSKLDSPVQQFAPIEQDLTREHISPLLQMKPLNSDLNFVPQPNAKATRTTPKSDIVYPMRTFNTEKVIPIRTSVTDKYPLRNIVPDNFSPIRTSTTESYSLPNIVTDDYSPFEYIHPFRTTLAVKPLRKLKKLFNMRTGTDESIPTKETVTFKDADEDEDDESIVIDTNNKKEKKIIETDLAKEMECEEIELDATEASTENSTVVENKLVSGITRNTTLSEFTKQGNSRRHKTTCTVIKNREFDGSPRTLHEIVVQLKTWGENSPVAKWIDITNGNYTTMENPIYMMIVDDLSKGQIASAKETVLIVAGIRGKDHYAVSAAMSLLQKLIEKSESHSDLHLKYRFWIIPVLNPDGYDYSMTFPLRRHWFKNLRQTWNTGKDEAQGCQGLGISCTIQTCYGVNLDRNFEYQWIPPKELEAEHPCGPLYAGPRQLSEVETRALTQYLDKKHIHTFIAYKEGDVLGVLYPYSHTKKKRPLDNFYRVRALRAATAASVAGGRAYVYGQTSEYLPLYAGGIEDWVDGHLGIDNTYSIMVMTKTDDKEDKALIERVTNEAFAATHALLFPSDYDQNHLPLAIRSRNGGTKISTEFVVFVTFVILGNG